MTQDKSQKKLRAIEKAMESFPKFVRLQERAHREEMKIRKAFGKLSLEPKKAKSKSKKKWTLDRRQANQRLNRESRYKALAKGKNSRTGTIINLFVAMDYTIRLEPKKTTRRSQYIEKWESEL